MNPTTHRPIDIEVEPIAGPHALTSTDLHILRMRYRPSGHMQVFLATHIPAQLLQLIHTGRATAVHVETMEQGSAAQRCLSGWPDYVVTGVETSEGSRVVEVPRALVRLRTRHLVAGGCLGVAGAVLLAGAAPVAGAALLVLASHAICRGLRVPVRAFNGQVIQG